MQILFLLSVRNLTFKYYLFRLISNFGGICHLSLGFLSGLSHQVFRLKLRMHFFPMCAMCLTHLNFFENKTRGS
jgi:hypothetical protein